MFEIINDVVKELNLLRIQNTMQQPAPGPGFFQPMRNYMPPFNIDEILNNNSSDVFDGTDHKNDNDDESDESSDVGDSEDEDDNDEDDEEDDDIVNNSVIEESNENVVKIINVNQETLTELDVENLLTNDDLPNLDDEDSDQLDDEDEDEDEDEDHDNEQVDGKVPTDNSTESILVEKIEPIEEVETNTDSIDTKESDKEVYKKMSLGALKALVISKGLCSDARTLRKNDLLKLLEAE